MPLENFTTYTEVDVPADRIQRTANHIDHLNVRNETTYKYKDYTANHFGDFTHTVNVKQIDGDWQTQPWTLGTTIAGALLLDPALGVYFYNSGGVLRVALFEIHATSGYTSSHDGVYVQGTWYYLKIIKAGTSLKLGVYSTANLRDAGDATDGDITNCFLTLHADHKLRFIYPCQCWVSAGENSSNGDIENLDLHEGWSGKVNGVTNPAKINGIAVADIAKVNGIVSS